MAARGASSSTFNLPLPRLREIGFRDAESRLVFISQTKIDGVSTYAVLTPERVDGELISFSRIAVNAGNFPSTRFPFWLEYRVGCAGELSLANGILSALRTEQRNGVEQLASFLSESFKAKKGLAARTATSASAARR